MPTARRDAACARAGGGAGSDARAWRAGGDGAGRTRGLPWLCERGRGGEAAGARRVRGAMPDRRRLWDELADVRPALEWPKSAHDPEGSLLGNLRLLWLNFAPA